MEYCGGGSLQDIYHGTVNTVLHLKLYLGFYGCCLTFLDSKGMICVDLLSNIILSFPRHMQN